jgi:hypothetical protein
VDSARYLHEVVAFGEPGMNAPLGDLAHAVLEQFGERARHALGRALARRGSSSNTLAFIYGEGELARQKIQPGNWVTMGEVVADGAATLIEVNIGSGASRERLLNPHASVTHRADEEGPRRRQPGDLLNFTFPAALKH